jgi:hypothetical protein
VLCGRTSFHKLCIETGTARKTQATLLRTRRVTTGEYQMNGIWGRLTAPPQISLIRSRAVVSATSRELLREKITTEFAQEQ